MKPAAPQLSDSHSLYLSIYFSLAVYVCLCFLLRKCLVFQCIPMSGHVRNKIFTLANLANETFIEMRKIFVCTQHIAMTMFTKMSFYFTDEYTWTIYSVDKLQPLPNEQTHPKCDRTLSSESCGVRLSVCSFGFVSRNMQLCSSTAQSCR